MLHSGVAALSQEDFCKSVSRGFSGKSYRESAAERKSSGWHRLSYGLTVRCDGSKDDRPIVKLTNTDAFGTKVFRTPFDATGKKWIRFDAWDSAGSGA